MLLRPGRKEVWKWFDCKSGQYPSAKVHRLLKVEKNTDTANKVEDYTIGCDTLPDLEVEVYDGLR